MKLDKKTYETIKAELNSSIVSSVNKAALAGDCRSKRVLAERMIIDMFPEDYFMILEYNNIFVDLFDRTIGSSDRPSFLLSGKDGTSFYVDCRIRSSEKYVPLLMRHSASRFIELEKETGIPIWQFVVIGDIEDPERIGVISMEEAKRTNMSIESFTFVERGHVFKGIGDLPQAEEILQKYSYSEE